MDNYYSDSSLVTEEGQPGQGYNASYNETAVSPEEENQPIKIRTYAHPSLVLLLMLVFFPAGIIAMLFFTKWGAFAKVVTTLFVLATAWAIYEVLVLYNVIDLPSLVGMIVGLWNDYINI